MNNGRKQLLRHNLSGIRSELTLLEQELDATGGEQPQATLQKLLDRRDRIGGLMSDLPRTFLVSLGNLVGDGEFPECVAIGNDEKGYFASGVLLKAGWLLTSSHCSDADKMSVGISIVGDVYPIKFHSANGLLALFEVSGFNGSFEQPALPPDDYPLVAGTTPLRVVAFGETGINAGTFGKERKARFVVDKPLKFRIYAKSVSGICPGDSGGPAYYDGDVSPRMLLGICDSVRSDDPRSGGIFANVVGNKGWIEGIIGPPDQKPRQRKKRPKKPVKRAAQRASP